MAVEEDSGDAAEEKDDDDTDKDWGKVQLGLYRASGSLSGEPGIVNSDQNIVYHGAWYHGDVLELVIQRPIDFWLRQHGSKLI